jgi:hypothetical protein
MVERYKPKEYIGFKQPPKHTRFKKGQSGNPSGRRRREPIAAATILAEELHSTVSVTENGRPLNTDKFTLVVKQAVNQAIKGNFRPFTLLVKMLDSLERLIKTPTKKHPRIRVDLTKLSLEEKQKMLNEIIANSKPLEEY